MQKVSTFFIKITLSFVLAVFISACASTQKELPKVSHDGLDLVEGTKLGAVYKKPGADLSQYDRVAMLDCTVAFRKNSQRNPIWRSGPGC